MLDKMIGCRVTLLLPLPYRLAGRRRLSVILAHLSLELPRDHHHLPLCRLHPGFMRGGRLRRVDTLRRRYLLERAVCLIIDVIVEQHRLILDIGSFPLLLPLDRARRRQPRGPALCRNHLNRA